jgi:hypothetical protein
MSKTILLRLMILSSVALAVLFQVAFLVEIHSPLPSALVLWSLSILSLACLVIVLLARTSLAANAKVSYAPESVNMQRPFGAGERYRVLGTYCVILFRQPLANPMQYPRTKSFYLSEASADRALMTASIENPQWRAIGVEPNNLSARKPQSDRSYSTSETWHVA